jgi:aspartyl-tRNA(Asn)/glutamyl-tRNA(Gln) amidotransferase subunit C
VPISRSDVLKIADLAKLHLSEDELDAFTAQFQRILDYIEKLKEIDVRSVEPTSHVALGADYERHMFREDEVKPSLSVDDAVGSAPEAETGQFRVPKVI